MFMFLIDRNRDSTVLWDPKRFITCRDNPISAVINFVTFHLFCYFRSEIFSLNIYDSSY